GGGCGKGGGNCQSNFPAGGSLLEMSDQPEGKRQVQRQTEQTDFHRCSYIVEGVECTAQDIIRREHQQSWRQTCQGYRNAVGRTWPKRSALEYQTDYRFGQRQRDRGGDQVCKGEMAQALPQGVTEL